MTDRKLKRLLAEKPFLIDDNFSMTGGEAELMLMENSPLSIEDMLVKVRQKDGWKPEFEQMIKRILANTPIARWNRLRANRITAHMGFPCQGGGDMGYHPAAHSCDGFHACRKSGCG